MIKIKDRDGTSVITDVYAITYVSLRSYGGRRHSEWNLVVGMSYGAELYLQFDKKAKAIKARDKILAAVKEVN